MRRITFLIALLTLISVSACSVIKKNQDASSTNSQLAGEWELTYITGPRIAFDGLYPEKKPTLTIDTKENRVSGNNSCNSFGGEVVLKGDSIKFDKVHTTMMACPGNGEATFMKMFNDVKTYSVTEGQLSFFKEDVELMRFKKK